MVKKLIGYVVLSVLLFLTSACTSKNIIRDSDYQYSLAAYKSGDLDKALTKFPKKESGGFLTSLEKSWIGLWQGETHHDALMAQAQTLDARQYISVSREAEYFFYSESEDGYIPAEHEIIVLHIINALYFLRQEKWEQARVETQKATFYLQNYFKDGQSHFDDPAMRLWLAGLWAAIGEWPEAQVDLRRAYELSRNENLRPLLEMKNAPEKLHVIFDGTGPIVEWKPEFAIPEFKDERPQPRTPVHFSTLPWYLRHQLRNTEIRNFLMKSHYMAQFYGLNTSVAAEKSVGVVASSSLKALGIVTGVAIAGGGLYLLAQTGATGGGEAVGYILGAGVLTFSYLWKEGDRIYRDVTKSAEKARIEGLENMRTYRFMRYLPSWISFSLEKEFQDDLTRSFSIKSPKSATTVLFVQRF